MSDVWTPEKFGETLAVIFRRSATDAEFRQLCLSAPDAALEEAAGFPVPEEARGKVRFSEARDGGILLPPFGSRRAEASELTDTELEMVSGGGSPYCMFTDGCYCLCTGKFTEGW